MLMLGAVGATAMLVSVTVPPVTVSVAVAGEAPVTLAVMVVEPAATPVAKPPLAVIVAIAVFEELNVVALVTSLLVLFEYVAVTAYCCVAFTAMDAVAGVRVIPVIFGTPLPPQPATINARHTKSPVSRVRGLEILFMTPPQRR